MAGYQTGTIAVFVGVNVFEFPEAEMIEGTDFLALAAFEPIAMRALLANLAERVTAGSGALWAYLNTP